MRKIWPAWALVIMLFSCKKEDVEKPKPEPLYYPVEITRTTSNSADIYTYKYTYNAEKQLIREDIYKANALENYYLFTYTAAGKLHKKRKFSNTDRFLEQDEILYTAGNVPQKLLHSYADPNGTPSLHHYRTYVFNSEEQLIKWTDLAPDNEITQSRNYVYPSPTFAESVGKGSQGEFLDKITTTYDGKKHPFSATNTSVISFPGNELKQEIKDQNNVVVSTINTSYEYNDKGYPVKLTQTRPGAVITETYVYKTE